MLLTQNDIKCLYAARKLMLDDISLHYTIDEVAKHDVIDVYEISNGHYLKSFYIPTYNKERLKDFGISGDKIIVLYSNRIMVYSIPFNL